MNSRPCITDASNDPAATPSLLLEPLSEEQYDAISERVRFKRPLRDDGEDDYHENLDAERGENT